jgi:hypothetical protein
MHYQGGCKLPSHFNIESLQSASSVHLTTIVQAMTGHFDAMKNQILERFETAVSVKRAVSYLFVSQVRQKYKVTETKL